MKRLMAAAAIVLTTNSYGVCIKLDYAEMKDMSAKELEKAYCAAIAETEKQRNDAVMADIRSTSSNLNYIAPKDLTQCEGEVERLERVLKGKKLDPVTVKAECGK